ncbi:MAG: hypothetical protein IPQ01_09105 [Zoogloea sp.]|nr:hypothetical protein [Zoogloea sp.]
MRLADPPAGNGGVGQQLDRVGAPAKKMSQEQELVDDPVDRSLAGV